MMEIGDVSTIHVLNRTLDYDVLAVGKNGLYAMHSLEKIGPINNRNKMVAASMEKELADLKEKAQRAPVPIESSPSNVGAYQFSIELNPRIRRVSPDELYSEDFRHRNYFVHLSADQSVLTIRPHDRGNIVCLDNRITLSGLGLISPYGGPADMPAEYNPKYGGYVVYLKYIPSTSHY